MKKGISFLLVTIMLFSLTACGNSGSGNGAESSPSDTLAVQEESQSPAESSEEQETPEEENTADGNGKTLVVYYSASGNTEAAANYIAAATGGDLFSLEPVNPYTDADLDYNDDSSRVVHEHDNPDEQNVELVENTVENWEEYSTVFIGYPIWWGIAAWPVNDFIVSNDFTGKTVVPFATSASSGLGESGTLLEEMAGTGNWLEGQRFSSNVSESDVQEWIGSLGELSAPGADVSDISGTPEGTSNTLVVYFSMPETTDPDNMTREEDNSVVVIDGEVLGNTQYVAYVIQETTGADIFRIEPETPYPTDHDTLVDLAAEEQDADARPAISGQIENFEQYDTVFVGYPNWWGDMPMILYTFFDTYDFSGKTIIPFNTHGGSGFSNTINTIAGLEPGAAVHTDGFTVSRDNVEDAEPDILAWLESVGY